jgi:2-polyprenyl-3-methyl-5-hydroxy-6-metoxy-1,4-benzoquinol methylase
MSRVESHYATHLAPIYEWMVGGAERAFALGEADLSAIRGAAGFAIDLGAGFGMHAVPLAKAGFQVLALDSSALLLDRLRTLAADLSVNAILADLLDFPARIPPGQKPSLIICMGDTLTHLPATANVAHLAVKVAGALSPQGRFVATFRD